MHLGEHSELIAQHEKVKANMDLSEEAKNAGNTELHTLRLKLSELTSINTVLEKELSNLKMTATTDQGTLQQKISTLNATIDEIRQGSLYTWIPYLLPKYSQLGSTRCVGASKMC